MQDSTGRAGSQQWCHPAEDGLSSIEYDIENLIYYILIFVIEVVGGGFDEKTDEVTFNVLRLVTREHRHGDMFAVEFEGDLPTVIFTSIDLSNRDAIHFIFFLVAVYMVEMDAEVW